MKKGCILLLLLLILSLPGSVFATNWVRVGTGEYFIDSETVEIGKGGSELSYWEYYIGQGGYKWLSHYYIRLKENPQKANLLKGFLYKPDNQLEHEIIHPHSFSVPEDSAIKKAIDVALGYAQEKEQNDEIPKLP